MRFFIAIMTLCLFPMIAFADYLDGNEIQKLSRDENSYNFELFRGYVAGIQDGYNGEMFCVHSDVRLSQAVAVVKKYLNENPNIWHLPAKIVVIEALKASFPCTKSTSG